MTRPYRFLSTAVDPSVLPAAQSPAEAAVQSNFIFIISALLCGLVCVVGLLTVAHCARIRRRLNSDRTRVQSPANKGVDKKVMEALPKLVYDSTKEETAGKLASGDCVICLAEYVNGDEIRMLPQCGHDFHVECIDMWLASHSSCPSCRQVLVIGGSKKCGDVPASSDGGCRLVVQLIK